MLAYAVWPKPARATATRLRLNRSPSRPWAELGWYAQAETTGESREPIGDNLLDAVHGHYAARDGKFVTLNLIGDSVLRRLREATGMKTLAYDPQGHEIHGDHARYLVVEEIKQHIADWIGARSQDEVLRVLQQAGLVAEPCRDSVEAEEYTHQLPCFHDVDDPDLGPIWTPGPVIDARDLEPVDLSRAPHPGEHTYEILDSVSWVSSPTALSPRWNDRGLSPGRGRMCLERGPAIIRHPAEPCNGATHAKAEPSPSDLSALRILDLSSGIAGGYCTKLLADYGAGGGQGRDAGRG